MLTPHGNAKVGLVLHDLLTPSARAGSSGASGSDSPVVMSAFGVVFALAGGLQAVKPRITFKGNRWMYKNPDAVEPSDLALAIQRAMGAVVAVVGVVLVVVAITKLG